MCLAAQEVGDPAALQELADRVGGTWHIETANPEAGTDHAIRVGILSRHVTTDAAGRTPSIDDDPTQRRGAPGSDHRPVLASIDL